MTTYHQAWLFLHQQRDMLYLTVFLAMATGFYWYRFGLHRFYWPVLAMAMVMLAAGIGWGVFQI